MTTPGLASVYPVYAPPGTRKALERDLTRLLGDVDGFDLTRGLIIVGGMPGRAAAVEPVRLAPLGTPVPKAAKTKIHFMVCFTPNYVCNFVRSINPGLAVGSAETVHQGGSLPGMSSRVLEGTTFNGLGAVWPHLFSGSPPRFEQITIRDWEVITGGRPHIHRVNVAAEIRV